MRGRVQPEVFAHYARAWSGRLMLLPAAMVLLAAGERTMYGIQNWWLSVWSNAGVEQVQALADCKGSTSAHGQA